MTLPTASSRLFLALLPDVATVQRINELQSSLRNYLAGAPEIDSNLRWVAASQIHLTVVFVGTTNADLTLFIESLRSVTRRFSSMEVTFNGLSCFPSIRPPQVIWLACKAPAEFYELQNSLTFVVNECLPELTGDSAPAHITLARVPRQRSLSISSSELNANLETFWQRHRQLLPSLWTASRLELLASTLTPRGARYSTVASLPLGDD